MFDRICIPPKYPEGTSFDIGQMAESLLFYGEVIIILKYSSLKGLLQQCNPETIIRLLEHGRLKLKYTHHMLGAISRNENLPFARYDFGLISSEKQRIDNAAQTILQEITGKKGKGRRLANRLIKYIEPINYEGEITKQIVEEIQDGKFISEYIFRKLKKVDSSLSQKVIFNFAPVVKGEGFPLQTNINFIELSKLISDDTKINKPSAILADYGTTIADLSLWSKYNTEVAVNNNQADVLQSRFDVLLSQQKGSEEIRSNFQDFVLDDSKAIQKSINSGDRTLEEFCSILERSDKFSSWIRGQEPDSNLVKSYYKEATSNSWVDKLPSKASRWAIFTGTGIALDLLTATGLGTATGVAISAFDSFVLDKLIKGWKPNQFINDDLLNFIKK
jgi:K+/H+ antiporter YhaU regulatory subunit KhtT